MNKSKVITEFTIDTLRYDYTLKSDGTRDIDQSSVKNRELKFSFDTEALAYLLFRTGPSMLNVGQYRLYFNYKDNNLNGIHFEYSNDGDNYIFIVRDVSKFLEECRKAYIGQIVSLKTMEEYTGYRPAIEEDTGDYMDEFDI